MRRDLLHRRRISNVLGVDGSPLDLLLQRLLPLQEDSHCLFLLTFGIHFSSILVHRATHCCSRCCPHSNFASDRKLLTYGDTISSSYSLRKPSLSSVPSLGLGEGFSLEGHRLVPCLRTSTLSIYRLDVKPAGKAALSSMADGVRECPNRSNHQTAWSIIPLSDFFDPSFEGISSMLPPNPLTTTSSTVTTTNSSSSSSLPFSEASGSGICEACGVTIPLVSHVQSTQPTTPAPHVYANFEMCTKANTLPWKRGGAAILSSSANSAWTSVRRQPLQQQPRTTLLPSFRSDYLDERKRSQPQTHPNSYTTPLSCSTSQASSPGSPPLSSYCNLLNVVLPSSASSNNSSGTSRILSRSTVEQQVAGETSAVYVNWPMFINRGGGGSSGNNRRGVPRGGRIRSSHTGVPPPMPSGRLHPESPSLRRSYCCPSTTTDVPDEVRDPKRNYALVDLRPSPASSVFSPSELQITTRSDNSDPANADTSASTLRAVPNPSVSGEDRHTAYRRRHSHSLSSALPEPILNYVHVVTTCGQDSKHPRPSSVSRALSIEDGGKVAAVGDSWGEASTSASSGGELASQSIMTDSATSSKDSQKQQQPPTVQPEVAYAQIDFVRTCALSSVNGTLDNFCASTVEAGGEGGVSKATRSNRSKAVSRSLRMMVKGSRKKSDVSCLFD